MDFNSGVRKSLATEVDILKFHTDSVLDSLTDHIAVLDSEGYIVYVNQSWEDFGLQNGLADSTVGMNYLSTCVVNGGPDAPYAVQAASGIRAILRGESDFFQLEYPCHSPDEKRWFMMNARPLKGALKPHVVVSHTNITERKLLEENQVELNRIIRKSPAVAFTWLPEPGWPVTFVSENVMQFGYSASDFLVNKLLFAKIIHPGDLDRVAAEVERYTLTQVPEFLQQYRIITKNGQMRWVEDFTWVLRDENGTVISYQGTIQDITDRKLTDHQLEKLYEAVKQNPASIVITNAAGNIEYVNPKFTQITGYEASEVIGKNPRVLKSGYMNEDGYRELWQTITAGNIWRGEFQNRKKNGELYWETASISPVKNPQGEITHFVAVKEDISAQKVLMSELEKQRVFVETVLDTIADIFVVVDTDLNLIRWNKHAAELTGYTDAEIASMKVTDFLIPRDVERLNHVLKNIIADGTQVVDFDVKTRDGRIIPHEFSLTPLDGFEEGTADGLVGVCGIGRDITPWLEVQEERKRLFSLSQDLMCIVDFEGNFIELNPAWQEILGWTLEELRSKKFFEFVHPEDRRSSVTELRRLTRGEKIQGFENRYRCKDGSYRWLSWNCTPLLSKRVAYGIARDNTNKKHVVEILRKSEEKYRTLFEESKDVIYFFTPEGRLLDINGAGVDLLGYDTLDELLAVNLVEDLYVNTLDNIKIQKLIEKDGFVKDFELELKKKNGQVLTGLVTITPVYGEDGEINTYRGILRDITELKKLNAQLLHTQKLEAIGTLAGGIAHDFNNILSAIFGYVELLRWDLPEESTVRENVEQILTAGMRASRLVKQILAFSRREKQFTQEVKISVILKEAIALLRASLPPSIKIEMNFQDVGSYAMVDPSQIHQVIMNLCTNAYQAMEKNGGTLGITLDKVTFSEETQTNGLKLKSGDYIELTISDTGHGMDEETLKHIFEPFFTTKPVGKGTGLGLAVVHGIVKSHGGDIKVKSVEQEGSTFIVYLPRVERKTVTTRTEKSEKPSQGNEHILLIDDEEPIVRVTQKILQRLGYRVTGLTDARKALEIFNSNAADFDVVITDLAMPELSGDKLAMEFQSVRQDLPIILATGFNEGLSGIKAKKIGIRAILKKPLTAVELSKEIRKVLSSAKKRGT